MPIHFFNEDTAYKLKGKRRIASWIKNTLKNESKELAHINIIMCSDSYLHKINLDYLKHDTFTDIVTFQYNNKNDKLISGDLFISIERVKENAKKFNIVLLDELNRVIIHGVLHLCGFKDKKQTECKEMRIKEDYYLSLLCNTE